MNRPCHRGSYQHRHKEAMSWPEGRKLRLSRDTGCLMLNQRIFYEENGYLVISKLISQSLLDKLSQRFDDIAADIVDRGVMTLMRDIVDRKAVNKVQDINFDKVFCEYIESKTILDIIEGFIGSNIMAMHSMLIAKPPDAGFQSSRHPPHQDLYYFPFRPADKIVAAWTAIEACDIQNGCLFLSPASHLPAKLYPHKYPDGIVNKFYHGIQDLPEDTQWLDLEMQPGDTIFFHPLLIHGSGVNKSAHTRKAISCHYAAADCTYIDVKGTVQEPIRNEILQLVQQRHPGVQADYREIWQLKSSLVRGLRSSL